MIRFLQSGNKAAKYLLAALILVFCLSMVIYLIPGLTSGMDVATTGVVANVGGEKITVQDVQRTVSQMMNRPGQRMPEQLRPYFANQAVRGLIQQAELNYEGKRLGLTVSDPEVQEELRNGPYKEVLFPKGQWIGHQQYEDLLTQNGSTPAEFERQVRYDLLRTKLMTAITAGVDVAPAEIERSYRDKNTKVKFDYALIDAGELKKQINPTDAELRAYYEQHKAAYQNSIPEKRALSYFVIGNQQVESKAVVTAADVEKYYQDKQNEFRLPDKVKARHILVRTPSPGADGKVDSKAVDAARAKASDLLKQLKAGGDFAQLAKKNSDDPGSAANGGDLPWMEKGQFVPEFDKAAFTLPKGQISDLVQTSFGFHIIQVQDRQEARLRPLNEVRSDIETKLKQPKLAAALEQMGNAAAADGPTLGLQKAAAKYGVQVQHMAPIGKAEALPGVGIAPEVMSVIFSANEKSPVQAARASNQSFVIFQVDKVVPPGAPVFEQLKDRVTTEFKAQRANELLSRKTQELADRAGAERDLKKAAKELGATVKTSDFVGRTDTVPDMGPMSGSAKQAFELKPGDIGGPFQAGQKGAVIALLEIKEAPMGDDFAKAKDGIREELLNNRRQEVLQLYLSDLSDRLEKKEGKVKTYKNELEALTRGQS